MLKGQDELTSRIDKEKQISAKTLTNLYFTVVSGSHLLSYKLVVPQTTSRDIENSKFEFIFWDLFYYFIIIFPLRPSKEGRAQRHPLGSPIVPSSQCPLFSPGHASQGGRTRSAREVPFCSAGLLHPLNRPFVCAWRFFVLALTGTTRLP